MDVSIDAGEALAVYGVVTQGRPVVTQGHLRDHAQQSAFPPPRARGGSDD